MNWINLTNISQINEIIELSKLSPVLIFKHSTRCSISSTALNRLERAWNIDHENIYYLDLIAHRDISNALAETFQVEHQSPQVMIISNGKSIFDESHWDISFDTIEPILAQTA